MSRCPHGLPLFDLTESTNRQARLEAMYILRAAIRLELTPRQRTCLLMYYENGFTMQEIAEQSGVSRQAVWDIIRRAEQSLLDYEEKTGQVARAVKRRQELEALEELVSNLPDCREKQEIARRLAELND